MKFSNGMIPYKNYFKIVTTIIYKKVAGLAFGARSGVTKNIIHRKQTEKQKIKMATIAPK